MSRPIQQLHAIVKLCGSVFRNLADLPHRVFSPSRAPENENAPGWFMWQDKPSVARSVGYWIRVHPIWVAMVVGPLLGLLSMAAVTAHRSSIQLPTTGSQRTQSTVNKSEANKEHSASPRTDASYQNAQVSLTADRQEVAKRLGLNLEKQGLDDLVVVAGGERNDTLILSSDLFQDTARQAAELRIARTYWKDLLCKCGFKAVVFDGRNLFGSRHEYSLQCPQTPGERVSMAAGLQADFQIADKGIQVHATGPNKEVLSLVSSTEVLQSAANGAGLFHELKDQGIVRDLCAKGFKQVTIRNDSPGSKPSDFSLNCALP